MFLISARDCLISEAEQTPQTARAAIRLVNLFIDCVKLYVLNGIVPYLYLGELLILVTGNNIAE